jgi:hypothetical protein
VRDIIIESTIEVGHRFRYTMRVDCGQSDPGGVIRPVPGEGHPRSGTASTKRSLPIGAPGRNAVYQLAALTIGTRFAVADA